MELMLKTQRMIDDIKNVCAQKGLSNTGNEYKIITEIFLYKFLNDKFLYEARKNLNLENLNFSEIESRILEMSKEEFQKVHDEISVDAAKLKREHLLSSLGNRQNEEGFHLLLDQTLKEISENNRDIFSGQTGDGEKIELFTSISEEIKGSGAKKDEFCKALIDKILRFSFEEAFKQKYDFFSTIFEYLIRDYNKDSGKYAEYYTPHTIAMIIAKILAPNSDKSVSVYDPSAGTGTLLLALAHQIGEDRCTLYSQDISQKSNELLRLNLILNNLVHSLPNVIHDDTLLNPYHKNESKIDLRKFDYIVSNPPFNMDFSDMRETLAGEAHQSRFFAGVPDIPKKKKDSMAIYLMFIQHIIYSLNEKGKAAIVVPTGFLTAGSGIPYRIREHIIERKMLKGVISMPSNVFATTGTNVSILFLDKSPNERILLLDASKLGQKTKEGKNQKTILQEADTNLIIQTFNSAETKEDFSILLSPEEIKAKNYSFSAGQYFDFKVEHIEITPEEFDLKIKDHQERLKELFSSSDELQKQILENFKRLRLGE